MWRYVQALCLVVAEHDSLIQKRHDPINLSGRQGSRDTRQSLVTGYTFVFDIRRCVTIKTLGKVGQLSKLPFQIQQVFRCIHRQSRRWNQNQSGTIPSTMTQHGYGLSTWGISLNAHPISRLRID